MCSALNVPTGGQSAVSPCQNVSPLINSCLGLSRVKICIMLEDFGGVGNVNSSCGEMFFFSELNHFPEEKKKI